MINVFVVAIIIVIIFFIIYYFGRRDSRSKGSKSRKSSNVQSHTKYSKVSYPKPNAKATFDRSNGQEYRFEVKSTGLNGIELPQNFSAIKHWSGMITGVYDQEACGSCWAFATCSAFTDRIRIKSNGKHLKGGDYISPFSLAACIKCGKDQACPLVCEGNYLDDVLQYLVDHGAAAQSDIDTHRGENEEYHCFDYEKAGVQPWKGLKKYRVNLYPPGMLDIGNNMEENEKAIMEDIYQNGPVCSIIKVFVPPDSRNFYNYRSGIYGYGWKSEPKESDGYHAITIVGWGEEIKDGKTAKYWIVRNSWGAEWGTNGLGKVLRGKNLGYIESDNWGIIPDV